MSLLLLPNEVISKVIHFLTNNCGLEDLENVVLDSFALNSSRIGNYSDVLALSSTCVRLRELCGAQLFAFVSLVRQSEIDAIMAYPSRMDKWSDRRDIHRRFMNEVLETNFLLCLREELAMPSSQATQNDTNGYSHPYSRYQSELSLNHYVTVLEVPNRWLRNRDLAFFSSLKRLKVLDQPVPVTEIVYHCPVRDPDEDLYSVLEFSHLTSLSVNMETLLLCDLLLQVLPQLTELSVIVDFNCLEPEQSLLALLNALGNRHSLCSFTFFTTDPSILQYTEFVEFLRALLFTGPVHSLILRLTRKSGLQAEPKTWHINPPAETGPIFLDALVVSSTLSSLMVDFDIINKLQFPEKYEVPVRETHSPDVRFYLIDDSLSVPKLLFRPRQIVGNIIQAILALEVVFIYGEVIDQSHLHAIGVMSNLLVYLALAPHRVPYTAIRKVSMEKAWSVSDDTLVRHHYESLLLDYECAREAPSKKRDLHSKICDVSLTRSHAFTSPRYRKREEYSVVFPEDEDAVPIILPTMSLSPRDNFWSVEALLTDLDHYCMREKTLSRIWD